MAKAGDFVKVHSNKGLFEGVLMPRPDILDKDITILKLKSGYNIGIKKANIKKIELVKEASKPKVTKYKKIKPNSDLPTVVILSTGGTISSRIDYRTGAVFADYSADDFLAMCPELSNFANIKAKKIMSVMSEDIIPDDWVKIAKEIKKELASCDGVVLTHGTDTMHFTSAALSFLLNNLSKPVILTGSQRSIDRGSSDAFMNLICSVIAASNKSCQGVFTCLHGSINDDFCILNPGAKVRKMHTSRRDTFRPVNSKPFAKVFPDGNINFISENLFSNKQKPLSVGNLNTNVKLIYVYPGMPAEFDLKNVEGIVIAATALGHVPSDNSQSLIPFIKKAVKKGIPVVITSQTLYGSTHPFVYSNLRKLSMEAGAIFVKDMLPEVAYVKLMCVLSEENDLLKVKELMQENLHGEMSVREIPSDFLF